MNKTIITLIVIALVLVGGYFLLRGQTPAPEVGETPPTLEVPVPEEVVRDITVSGAEFSLSPSSVTVKSGEKVRLTFTNDGRAPHNWTIEGLGVATKTIGGGKTDVLEFTAPSAGTYPVFCSVAGHREAGMVGAIVVE